MGIMGAIFFHLQHQVNIGYWKKFSEDDVLTKKNADFIGASVLKIPKILKFFTCGIEYHNVHHLNPGIPGYNLQKCYEELQQKGLIKTEEVGYKQSFLSLFHSIYNETTERYESTPFYNKLGLYW